MTTRRSSFHIITLGCAKNLVDSRTMAYYLYQAGFIEQEKRRMANYVIINTCGFIHDARAESMKAIKSSINHKRPGQKVIVTGCLSERLREDLIKQAPGIDGMIGTRDLSAIRKIVESFENASLAKKLLLGLDRFCICDNPNVPASAIQGSSAYLKIADGCRRNCAFCAIPAIKGPLISRAKDSILRDALDLQSQGVNEINLIAQDVTDYQHDLQQPDGLANLLEYILPQLSQVPWIRLLYTFPGSVSPRLIDLLADKNQLLPYLDIPLQHADPTVLQAMSRPFDMNWVRDTVNNLRYRVPELCLRTTFIVGYPNETEKSFNILLDFIQEIQFDHVGVFTYSCEQGTPAEKLGDPISSATKERRKADLMAIQASISLQKNQAFIGKTMDLLVEGSDPTNNVVVGRTWRNAPEIDGFVIATGKAEVGSLKKVRLTAAMEHDFYGNLIN